MRGTDHASHPLAFFTRRAWTGVFAPLVPMVFFTLYIGAAVMHSGSGIILMMILFAVCLAIITLVSTMCAGLVGVLAGLGTYICVCGFIALIAMFCSKM